jgi:hypothetical protein
MGSFAAIFASLINFCRHANLPVFTRIAETLEALDDIGGSQSCTTAMGIMEVYERSANLRVPLLEEESLATTQLVRGHRLIEVLERPGALDPAPEAVTIPEPRSSGNYITSPCKHEYNIIRPVRHAVHACRVLKALDPVKQALMRATTCQCGMDSSQCHAETVKEVAKLDKPVLGNKPWRN